MNTSRKKLTPGCLLYSKKDGVIFFCVSTSRKHHCSCLAMERGLPSFELDHDYLNKVYKDEVVISGTLYEEEEEAQNND